MEPKKLLLTWTADGYKVSEPNIGTCHIHLACDPAITHALRIAAWAKANNLLDENGEPRKIIGTLPVTADGCVVGEGDYHLWAIIKYTASDGLDYPAVMCIDEPLGLDVGRCFSTREAAEAKVKETTDGH